MGRRIGWRTGGTSAQYGDEAPDPESSEAPLQDEERDQERPDARVIAREAMLALFVGVGATAMPVAVLAVARVVADFLYETL
ncbi:hypothetical protein GS532_13420, partial [Rhodococcus hoagii]|nr:hypothetical protein [Prescottella equi]